MTYTKTLTKLASKATSAGHTGSGRVLKYSNGSIKVDANGGWAGVGWQFTLPTATAYRSISMGVYGYMSAQAMGVPPGSMLAQDFSVCGYSSTWDISCFNHSKTLRSSIGWSSRSLSPTLNRHGTAVRVAVSEYFGWMKIYKVRVVVTYGLLK